MSKNSIRKPEPILLENNSRYTQLPLHYPLLQKAYEIHESMFWTAKDIDYKADYNDWVNLTNDERYFIEHILAFFAGADGIVLENLVTNFCSEIKAAEARNFYGFQAMIENVHGQVYSLLLDTYVKDLARKKILFNAIDEIPCVAKKAEWAKKWINNDIPFEQRLVAFAIVEGVFFSGSFCAIFWLKSRGKMAKALGSSNELIARDEGLHTDFAILLHNHLNNKISQNILTEILTDAVNIEIEFICESLPCKLIGMNKELMTQYIKFVADRLVVQLGYNKIYNKTNPFGFMENTLLDGKTNFFEKRVTEYTNECVSNKNSKDAWKLDENF